MANTNNFGIGIEMPTAQDYLDTLESGFKTEAHKTYLAATTVGSGISLPTNFCSAWPIIKPIMQTVGGFLVYIPVWGTTAVIVFNGLMTVAQNIYDTACATPTTPA